ncbi:MAG: carbohydrate-binding family 9-like protein [Clostridia bacterium]|nr:carbohydrate-binding family 9-like protein [Clostridia bacterium]
MYIIKKADHKIECMCDKAWGNANVADVCIKNWAQFEYAPVTKAKILYSDYGIHVQMESDEDPILARYTDQNSSVCADSCMEFFFSPNADDKRYFNFEFNPFGTMYCGVRTSRYDPEYPTEDKKYFEVKTYVDDKTWKLQFCVPFEIIDRIFGKHSDVFKGNLYKCAEESGKEHYLSFYPLDPEQVDFHRPEFFGEFSFEK